MVLRATLLVAVAAALLLAPGAQSGADSSVYTAGHRYASRACLARPGAPHAAAWLAGIYPKPYPSPTPACRCLCYSHSQERGEFLYKVPDRTVRATRQLTPAGPQQDTVLFEGCRDGFYLPPLSAGNLCAGIAHPHPSPPSHPPHLDEPPFIYVHLCTTHSPILCCLSAHPVRREGWGVRLHRKSEKQLRSNRSRRPMKRKRRNREKSSSGGGPAEVGGADSSLSRSFSAARRV